MRAVLAGDATRPDIDLAFDMAPFLEGAKLGHRVMILAGCKMRAFGNNPRW